MQMRECGDVEMCKCCSPDLTPSSQWAIRLIPFSDFHFPIFSNFTGSCKTGNQTCWLCSMALMQMAFRRSWRNFSFSVREQISGMISLMPISVAFSRNHSKRLGFLTREIAILTFLSGAGCVEVSSTLTAQYFFSVAEISASIKIPFPLVRCS